MRGSPNLASARSDARPQGVATSQSQPGLARRLWHRRWLPAALAGGTGRSPCGKARHKANGVGLRAWPDRWQACAQSARASSRSPSVARVPHRSSKAVALLGSMMTWREQCRFSHLAPVPYLPRGGDAGQRETMPAAVFSPSRHWRHTRDDDRGARSSPRWQRTPPWLRASSPTSPRR